MNSVLEALGKTSPLKKADRSDYQWLMNSAKTSAASRNATTASLFLSAHAHPPGVFARECGID